MELQLASAQVWAPEAHCLSRVADHMDSQARCLVWAKVTSWVASETVKISLLTSLTPIIGVTAIAFQAAVSVSPSTLLTWAWVAVAPSIAYCPMSPVNEAP